MDRLRNAQLKSTGARLAILDLLAHDRSHPTAEQIHATLRKTSPSLSISTVYDTLDTFCRVGLCRRIACSGGKLRFDGQCAKHDHACCRACGRIFDVPRRGPRRLRTPHSLPRGLEVKRVHVEYEVLCAACRKCGPTSRERTARARPPGIRR